MSPNHADLLWILASVERRCCSANDFFDTVGACIRCLDFPTVLQQWRFPARSSLIHLAPQSLFMPMWQQDRSNNACTCACIVLMWCGLFLLSLTRSTCTWQWWFDVSGLLLTNGEPWGEDLGQVSAWSRDPQQGHSRIDQSWSNESGTWRLACVFPGRQCNFPLHSGALSGNGEMNTLAPKMRRPLAVGFCCCPPAGRHWRRSPKRCCWLHRGRRIPRLLTKTKKVLWINKTDKTARTKKSWHSDGVSDVK